MYMLQEQATMPLRWGSQIGKYRIKRLLKQGGMGSVYIGYNEDSLQTVAIKVLDVARIPGSERGRKIQQFQQEVQIMSRLHHRHIVPLLDAGREDTQYYIVMPYIQGGSLEDRLEEGSLTPEEAGAILEQVASALHYTHEQGIVHRDIKPANILLDREQHVYLADFGIACYIETAAVAKKPVMGTPLYMAPEAHYGRISPSGDIYALGVLLYEMVTGYLPFDGDDALTIRTKHIQEQAERPSQINPAISKTVERVILHALEKDPRNRFQTAEKFAETYNDALLAYSIAELTQSTLHTALQGLRACTDGIMDACKLSKVQRRAREEHTQSDVMLSWR